MSGTGFTLVPQGRFSLREAATFGFGQTVAFGQRVRTSDADDFDGAMRMAFCLDGYREQVGVVVRQDDDGVHVEVHGEPDPAALRAQVERVLSLDHDGRAFDALGVRDPVLGRLQAVAPGLRPPLFYSPYEAAAWSVLSARRPAGQMSEVRARLSAEYGRRFDLAGRTVAALPLPAALLAVTEFPGLPPEKIERLHGVAQAALDGVLDIERLRDLGPERAAAAVQQIKGIGPFYSTLITIRACGWADLLAPEEKRSLAAIRRLYGFDHDPTADELTELAEGWRPFRTWATVLIRAAADRPAGAPGEDSRGRRQP